mmetsp:Transcript_5613/g.9330  ORF Transcript_5613/g.9330 Transcript_5613/m.9330 type:complete len:212 (+) Transcript_5613:2026-2661(+)
MQLQMPSQRGSLTYDAFHQAAIASQHINVVVKDDVTLPIEASRHVSFCNGHANCIRKTLTQRTSCNLHATGHSKLWMSRCLTSSLSKLLECIDGDFIRAPKALASQMQHCIQHCRRMAVRQHEAISVYPSLSWGELHDVSPQSIRQWSTAKRSSQVSRTGIFHHIGTEHSDSVNRQPIQHILSQVWPLRAEMRGSVQGHWNCVKCHTDDSA